MLALRMLIAALLALALAQPEWLGAPSPEGARVVLLDATTSMSAGRRWPQALSLVREELAAVGDEGALVVVGPAPHLAWSGGAGLETVLSQLQPGGTGADVQGAISLARSVGDGAELVLIGDGGLRRAPGAEEIHRWRRVGESTDNLAILDAQALWTISAATGRQGTLFARVASFADRAIDTPLNVRIDGQARPSRQLELGPGESRDLTWRLPPSAELAELELAIEDGQLQDNVVRLPLDDRRPRVQWVGDSPTVARALAALPLAELSKGARARLSADGRFDVTVVVGPVPQSLPDGGLVLIDPPVGPWTGSTAPGADALTLTLRAGDAHPLLDGLDLPGSTIAGARVQEAPPWGRPVLRAPDRALVWEGRKTDRPVIVLAFDPEGGDVAERAAWPVLLGRAIERVASIPPPAAESGAIIDLPARWGEGAQVRAPSSFRWRAVSGAPRLVRPGLWSMRAERGEVDPRGLERSLDVWIPAGDPGESDLRIGEEAENVSPSALPGLGESRSRIALWPGIIALGCILMALEGASPGAARSRSSDKRWWRR